MTNSADPDQLASSEVNWSGSTQFAKAGYIRVQQDKGYNTTTSSIDQLWTLDNNLPICYNLVLCIFLFFICNIFSLIEKVHLFQGLSQQALN